MGVTQYEREEMTTNVNSRRYGLIAALGVLVIAVVIALVMGTSRANAGADPGYTEWVNSGEPVVNHENTPPGADTDLERWLPVGEPVKHVTVVGVPEGPYVATGETTTTDNEQTPPPAAGDNCRWVPVGEVDDDAEDVAAVPGQHYSWTGGNRDHTNPPTVVPPHDDWQANTAQEPHENGGGNPATWVNDSLHYTANSEHSASWFYYTHPKPKVEGKDFKWAKECKTPAVAEVSHLDYTWQKQVREKVTETKTPTPTPTETVPTEQPSVPETPEVPVEQEETPEAPEQNQPPKSSPNPPKDVQVIECVNGVFVTSVNGEVISESGSCQARSGNSAPTTFSETGL